MLTSVSYLIENKSFIIIYHLSSISTPFNLLHSQKSLIKVFKKCAAITTMLLQYKNTKCLCQLSLLVKRLIQVAGFNVDWIQEINVLLEYRPFCQKKMRVNKNKTLKWNVFTVIRMWNGQLIDNAA